MDAIIEIIARLGIGIYEAIHNNPTAKLCVNIIMVVFMFSIIMYTLT